MSNNTPKLFRCADGSGDWFICTSYNEDEKSDNGVLLCNKKYPVPEKTMRVMAVDYFLIKNFDIDLNQAKGYSQEFELPDGVYKITVKKVN